MAPCKLAACALMLEILLASGGRAFRKGQAAASAGARQPEDGDEYEYGDRETQVSHGDASDFSIHQFLVSDDARDGASSDSGGEGDSMARAKAMAADDHFNSEDTPDNTDSFAQVHRTSRKSRAKARAGQLPDDEDQDEYEYGDRESQVSHGDASDFSLHQFLVADDAREGASGDESASDSMARSKALAADDHFNSEDTPDNSDSFAQTKRQARKVKQLPGAGSSEEYEYGDREVQVGHSDASDFSIHQFLTTDDARDGGADGGDVAESAARAKALAASDHFNSEDTPDNSDSFAQTGGRNARKASPQPRRVRA